MSVWQVARAANAALTRTVTGAILAPHETQRLVVSDKTGNYSSASPGKSKCGPIDYGRRNGDTLFPAVWQYRLASLQEAPDGGVAGEADRDVEGIASLGIGMGSGQ
jgi:hypothetical protein